MIRHRHLRGVLAAILLGIIPTQLFPGQTNEIVRFSLVGDLNAHLRPNEATRIVVSAEAQGVGTLELRITGVKPSFVLGWDSKKVVCRRGCQLVDTLVVIPTSLDYGDYSFDVYAKLSNNGELIDERSRKVRIHIIPKVLPEPPYSRGSSNLVCWQPFEDEFRYELIRFNDMRTQGQPGAGAPTPLRLLTDLDSCRVFEDLPEGERFGYYLEAETPSGLTLRSNFVYSVQDQSPPPITRISQFWVSREGAVNLRWPYLQDEVSLIERYIVYRRQVNTNTRFAPVDTIPFFPVSSIQPPNYYPVRATEGQDLYVDSGDSLFSGQIGSEFKIELMPAELEQAALIKTAIQDRWNESDEFLSFTLEADAWLFVAFDFDSRNTSAPDWLAADFEQTTQKIEMMNGKLRLFKSKSIFSAGKITLGGNFARGIGIKRKRPKMYVVFVLPVDAVLPYLATNWIDYADFLGPENDLNTFKYKISTIDAVGNIAEGVESAPIVIDLNGHCKPIPTQWFTFESLSGVRFSKGLANEICIQDPLSDSNCVGFRDTDSLRFQAARHSVDLFDSDDPDDFGVRFFDSGWIDVEDLARKSCYLFELLPSGSSPNFVNGQQYFYRIRAKDVFGNTSVWSQVVDAIPDAFPPDDVASLSVESIRFDNGNKGCNQLSWSGATDLVSGVKSFIIYRKDEGADEGFSAIDTVDGSQASYCDSLSNFRANKIVLYKVGSVDNVSNIRSADNSSHQARIRALIGPTIQYDTTQIMTCPAGPTRITSDSITVFWQEFNNTDISGYEVEVRKPDSSKESKILFDTQVTEVTCPLDAGDGVYDIRVRAFYANRDTTIFSNTITIRRKVTLQGVQNLTAAQDSKPSGDIMLSWSHPDMMEIERFEVFTWKEGEAPPDAPKAVLPGHVTQWVHDFEQDNLVGYQCNFYMVRAWDCFGLVSSDDTVVSQYSNHPPTIVESRVYDDSIAVCWTRPTPRVKEDDMFQTIVLVYQDSVSPQPIDSATTFNSTCYTLISPEPKHNYFFTVKEIILDDLGQACSDIFESGWSGTIIVPFKNLPPPVSFEVQALPVHPDSATGRVFVAWLDTLDAVDTFLIKYATDDFAPVADSFHVQATDTILVQGLDISKTYGFNVIAIDSLGQHSPTGDTKTASFSPRWVFTPNIVKFTPQCFRDSVTIEWAWVDDNLVPGDESFGADSVIVQLSIDANFEPMVSERRLSLSRSYTFERDADYNFVNDQNVRLYARIRAKDPWGHISPWSTEYPELGSLAGNYDEIPPLVATCVVDSVKAPLFGGPGKVDVHISWQDVNDNCSGVWFYQIARDDSVIAADTSRASVHTFVDRNIATDETFLGLEWRIYGVDSVGNRQQLSNGCTVPHTVSAPDSGWCLNDTTVCWQAAHGSVEDLDIFYFVEGARFASLFGNALTNETAGPLDTLCYNFTVPWDGIFWRVKARAGEIESAWSDTFFCDLTGNGLLTTFGVASMGLLPLQFALQQNYPNPFNPSTTIRYAIPVLETGVARVVIEIFNIAGQRIRTLVDEEKPPSHYSVVWNGRDDRGNIVGSGVYFYRIRVHDFIASQKMILVK